MGTLNEKLEYLKETKNQIKEAIISKGQEVSSSDTFRSYASKISAIDTVNNENLTVNPMTSVQTFTPTQGHTGFGEVNVNAVTSTIDSNITAENIKAGVSVLGVVGSYEAPEPVVQDKTVNPTTSSQVISPDEGYDALSSVTVNAVSSSIDSNIVAGNIKQGVTILGVEGTVEELNGTTLEVTPSATTQINTPSGGYNAFTSVTTNGDENLTAENIAEGVTIFGVTGSFHGGEDINNQDITITTNGEYTPDEGYTGFGTVTVDTEIVNNVDLAIVENGTYTPQEQYTGFGTVRALIPATGSQIQITNATGSEIAANDKVWLNFVTREGGTSFSGSTTSNYAGVISGNGDYVIYANKLYSIKNNEFTQVKLFDASFQTFWGYGHNTNVVLFAQNEGLNNSKWDIVDLVTGKVNTYARYPVISNGLYYADHYYRNFNIRKLNVNDLTTFEFTISLSDEDLMDRRGFAFQDETIADSNYYGAKLWKVSEDKTSFNQVGSLTKTNLVNTYYMGLSSDYKLLMLINNNRSGTYGTIQFATVDNENHAISGYELDQMPAELQPFYAGNAENNYATYVWNQWSNILTVSHDNGVFALKRDPLTETWTNLNIELPGYTPNKSNYVSLSDDASTCFVAGSNVCTVYRLTNTAKWVAVAYDITNITNKSVTGTAVSTIANNAIGNVIIGGEVALEEKTIIENGEYTPSSGYDGFSKVIVNIPSSGTVINNQNKSVIPSAIEQQITADSGYTGLGTVTVSGDSDLVSENIKSGVNIFGVVGNVVESNNTTTTIIPTTSLQMITPDSPYNGFSSVTVDAVTNSIDKNIVAGNIKKDVTILGVTGTLEEGTAINNQDISVTTDGSYTADAGYTGLGTVTVTAGAVASAATQNEIAEELMLINDGATTFTLTVSPTDATPVITSTTNSVVLTPSSSSGGVSVYSISVNALKTYSYSVSKEGYVTSTGTINGGTASLTVTLVAES